MCRWCLRSSNHRDNRGVAQRLTSPAQPAPASAPPTWWRGFLAPIRAVVVLAIIALGAAWLVDSTRVLSQLSPTSTPSTWSPSDQANLRIVDADWLSEALADPNQSMAVVDLSPENRYEREHIPGSIHGWWQDGMDPHARVYGERYFSTTDPGALATWFASLGVHPGDTVVAYDNEGNRHAARLVWQLANAGFDNAVILDGGLSAWKGTGFETESGDSQALATEPEINGHGEMPVIDTEELLRIVEQGDDTSVVVDVRATDALGDTLNGTIPMGRIPGSVWVSVDVLYQSGTDLLRWPDEIASMMDDRGIDPGDMVVLYGRFGINTGLTWLVLDALGYADVRIYDQGWATWASDPDRPIEYITETIPPNGASSSDPS